MRAANAWLSKKGTAQLVVLGLSIGIVFILAKVLVDHRIEFIDVVSVLLGIGLACLFAGIAWKVVRRER